MDIANVTQSTERDRIEQLARLVAALTARVDELEAAHTRLRAEAEACCEEISNTVVALAEAVAA